MRNTNTPLQERAMQVSDLNDMVAQLLQDALAPVIVCGEISNLAEPQSGHCYFSLKDANAQVRCALFKPNRRQCQVQPEDGMEVLVVAQVGLYAPRGDFQLRIQNIYPSGLGAWQRAFKQCYDKLKKAGLFDPKHKRALPTTPRCIGVITSATGAAVQDIIKVLKRRAPQIPIIIYPSLVQGDKAHQTLTQAVAIANERDECDVLILARGGGSIEDLWAFNHPTLAQALFDSQIPIVTGIGHQSDTTIADYVADYRAATPSAAAECVSPDQTQLQKQLEKQYEALQHALLKRWQSIITKVQQYYWQLQPHDPHQMITLAKQRLLQAQKQLINTRQHMLEPFVHRLNIAAKQLEAISPLQTLARGYAMTFDQDGKTVLHSADAVKTYLSHNPLLRIRYHDGDVMVTHPPDDNTM